MQSQSGSALLVRGLVLVLFLGFLGGPVLRPLVRPYAYSDFATFYSAARCFVEGCDPYAVAALQDRGSEYFAGWIGRYFYPPPFAATAVRPLAHVRFDIARRIWVGIEAGAYIAALVLLARLVATGARVRGFVVAAGLAYAPMTLDLRLGSVSGLLLLMVVLFLDAEQRRARRTAALALAAAMLLKLVPALLLAHLALRRQGRLVAQTLAALAAMIALALPWTGVAAYRTYVTDVLPFLASASFSWFTNQSLDGSLWRLLVANPDTVPWLASPSLHRVLSWGTSAAVLAGLVWMRVRQRDGGREAPTWESSAVLVAGLLVARVTWEYMFVLALPCFALWMRGIAEGRVGRRQALVVALAYALCALPFPYAEAPIRSGPWLVLAAPRLYGALLLFALTLHRSVRHPSST